MKEIDSLIERALKYLSSADMLCRQEDYESTVSRTYYAMYFAVEALLLTKGLACSSHKGTLSAFGEHFVKTGMFDKSMGRELNRAFDKRQLGDYEFTFVITREEAEDLLITGSDFVQKVVQYLKANGYT